MIKVGGHARVSPKPTWLGYHPGGSKKKSPRHTDHTYRNFSKYPIRTDRTQNNFPAKLHQILSTPAFSHVSVNLPPSAFLPSVSHCRPIGPSEPPTWRTWWQNCSLVFIVNTQIISWMVRLASAADGFSSTNHADPILLMRQQPHGRAWKVHNKELLVTQVFPYFFNQTKYVSFTRREF